MTGFEGDRVRDAIDRLEFLRGAIVAHVVRGEPVGSAVVVLADAILGPDSQEAV